MFKVSVLGLHFLLVNMMVALLLALIPGRHLGMFINPNLFCRTYVVNRVTDKLTQLTKSIYCCRSGSAADTQTVADMVRYQLDFHRLEMNREPTVLEAAVCCQHFCYNYRDDLVAGIIVAGWDEQSGGQIYSIPLGGMLIRQPIVIGGSGSTYTYGYVDHDFRKGMTREECINFVLKGVALAINRDGSSGGCIRLAIISKDGVERILTKGDEVPVYRFS
ncbi:Proteasome subunit beta type-6 [Schistosoma japonicum]|nr:Proteasome subunit beta type-6 [Schistosoma japonicum]